MMSAGAAGKPVRWAESQRVRGGKMVPGEPWGAGGHHSRDQVARNMPPGAVGASDGQGSTGASDTGIPAI